MTPDTDIRRVSLRELDALVAEHVMVGWKVCRDPDCKGCDSEMYFAWNRWHGNRNPTGDWAHTGALWKELVVDGWWVSLEGEAGGVVVAVDRAERGATDHYSIVTGDYDPRAALCLAALRAHGVEVEVETEDGS